MGQPGAKEGRQVGEGEQEEVGRDTDAQRTADEGWVAAAGRLGDGQGYAEQQHLGDRKPAGP